MGYTSIEVLNLLHQHIVNSVLLTDPNMPNGVFEKYERPLNSSSEDIIIGGLANVRGDIDEGVLNMNIYVPNLVLQDLNDKGHPDSARILVLSKLGKTAFLDGEEIWDDTGTYCFKYQQDNVFKDENNQYYINFRIEFYSI